MPGQPFSSWTPGATLADYREITFGDFVFALTAQEVSRDLKLGMDRKKIPGGIGEFVSINSLTAREIEVNADMGSGMLGSAGNMLATQDDLEAERSLLAALQAAGKQKLYVRPDRYCMAYLSEFDHQFFQDGGAFRYATWKIKFVADDPRYFSPTLTSYSLGPITDTATHTQVVAQNGNIKAYPVITITGACTSPSVLIQQATSGGYVGVTFSQLVMNTGDTLVINCDPRPENRDQCVIYTPNGSTAVNGLRYSLLTDFINTLNAAEWFPYVEATRFNPGTQTFKVSSTASGNYTVTVAYRDTWI